MSLNITVGLLADIEDEDEEVVEEELHFLEEVNTALRDRGLPEHHEPTEPPEDYQYWTVDVSNGDLEELLGLAVTVADGDAEQAAERFPHLVGTQCSYYLPLEIPEPLLFEIESEEEEEEYELEAQTDDEEEGDDEDEEEFLIGVGSSLHLKDELAEVAKALNIPLDRFPIDYSGEGGSEEWTRVFEEMRKGNERCMECEDGVRALINLYHACVLSLRHKMVVCVG